MNRRYRQPSAAACVASLVLAGCSASISLPDSGLDAGDAGQLDGGTGPRGIAPTFTFESGPVRPLALSPDGTKLFAANTSNASLDIFDVTDAGVSPSASAFVGIDPVAVAVRTSSEVWVVNQISDSVSIVDVSTTPPHISRTLLVGDEPSDIVFGGPAFNLAFISTAHRGQQRSDPSLLGVSGAGDPELTTPGVSRADVWVFDATNPGATVGGTPVKIVSLFGDTPRGLAVTPDGTKVYASIFKSGNGTTAISSTLPCAGFDLTDAGNPCTVGGITIPGAPPGPATNYAGAAAPAPAMILKTDENGVWRDVLGRDWSTTAVFDLPDQDVFELDATTASPSLSASYAHVGTTLFNLVVNPVSGVVYVSNTQARNDLRFEGPGTFAHETLQGHIAESQITVLTGGTIEPRHLNKHIDYTQRPAPAATLAHSLATPMQMAVSSDGMTLYVCAFGSSKVGVFSTASLENDTFDPVSQSGAYLTVSGGGPGGLALDEARGRLYVATRFDDGLSVIDLASGIELTHVLLKNPEPAAVTSGRPFLYDATRTSSNGEAACASCHMFGDKDNLAWDLGNPDNDPITTPIPFVRDGGAQNTLTDGGMINGSGDPTLLHPMKGPMTTQTLRGLFNHGAMHWRGDRAVGYFGTDSSSGPPFDSQLSFKNFVVAFQGLVGLGQQLDSVDMQTFTNFASVLVMPPNPVRSLDNQLNSTQAAGRSFFLGCDGVDTVTGNPVVCVDGGMPSGTDGHHSDGAFTCQGCHTLNPSMGFFGTNGLMAIDGVTQSMKVPQLRNLYDKVGMFGILREGYQGSQVRGFGYLNNGSVDTLFHFLSGAAFHTSLNGRSGFSAGSAGDTQRQAVEQYMLAFDSDLAPVVGQQVTLRSDNADAVGPRIDLLIARAQTPFASKLLGPTAHECDLVARGLIASQSQAFRLQSDGTFLPDDGSAALTDAELRALASTPGQELTYTCLPPGWGASSSL
jgi:DNA-binding beta-propeller fold protein YncE